MKQLVALAALLSVVVPNYAPKPPAAKALVVHGVRWETAFEAATAHAKRDGKPILHLQSFGRPGDPMACTNTRTLTATVLKDPAMIELMKGTVPSWELVREAAKVTIDLGGGRVLRRTLRGNTCLFVLRPDGTVVDAFPGVYEPESLIPELRKSLELAAKSPEEVAEWHRQQIVPVRRLGALSRGVAGSKGAVEAPLLSTPAADARAQMPANMDPAEAQWRSAAARLFDISAIPMTPVAARDASGGLDAPTPKERGERLLQLETKENLGPVRQVIHLWLASLKKPITAPEAKQTVFETILHINYTDPYLGLKDVELPGTEG
jgi:hypothetical protein